MSNKVLHMCIPLYNRGVDVTQLLYNINDIHNKIKDVDIKVIIGDYHSTDVDLETIKTKLQVPINIILIDGAFNLSKSLQICSDTVLNLDDLIMHLDADTVIENGPELIPEILSHVKQGVSYYCPICSTEYKMPGTSSTSNGKIFIPNHDHGGSGLIIVYNSDYKKSNGFHNTEFMNDRGEKWGSHEVVLLQRLSFLFKYRRIESSIWLRTHKRDNLSWYSIGGEIPGKYK